ncbi:MAG: hypothetical protein WCQ99_14565, partial [Pseudomonadota bacterium]
MSNKPDLQDIERFLAENPKVVGLLMDPEKRKILDFFCNDFDRIYYLINNPWIDLEKIVRIADGVMNISPEISGNELLNILCRETALLTNAQCSTCRTYDPIKD